MTIEQVPSGTALTLSQFMDCVNNTKPQRLEDITGFDKSIWYGYRQNSRNGKMSIDKMLDIAKMLGCKIQETKIFINL